MGSKETMISLTQFTKRSFSPDMPVTDTVPTTDANAMSLHWKNSRAQHPNQVSCDTSVETTIDIVAKPQFTLVRGMVTINEKLLLLVAQFSNRKLADGLISMLVAHDAPGVMQAMSQSDTIEYKELPKCQLSPIPECAEF